MKNYETVITYKTIDPDNFIAKNRTPGSMKRALVEISQYYKKIANIAALAINKKQINYVL